MEVARRELDEIAKRLWYAHGYLEEVEHLLEHDRPDLTRLRREVSDIEWTLRSCVGALRDLIRS